MILIYITLFMTALLTFWVVQAYFYNKNVDDYLLSSLVNSSLAFHERVVETVKNDELSDLQPFNINEILSRDFSGGDVLLGSEIDPQCFYNDSTSGSIVMGNCYKDDPTDTSAGYLRDFNYDASGNNAYGVKTQVVADPDVGWVEAVSYVDVDMGITRTVKQRDLFYAALENFGSNANMGLVKLGDTDANGDWIVTTGSPSADRRTISSAVVGNCAAKDPNRECFVVFSDLFQIPAIPQKEIWVNISDVNENFTYKGTTYNGAMFNGYSYGPQTLSFTVDDDNDATNNAVNNPKIDLFVSISGFSSDGAIVPPTGSGLGASGIDGYNPKLLDPEDIVFKDVSGNVVTEAGQFSRNMTLEVSPNYNQYGGAYVTITAKYTGTGAKEDTSVLVDSMSFLVIVDEDSFECDENFLDKLPEIHVAGEGTAYAIGNPGNRYDTKMAAEQLICLSKLQSDATVGSKILSSNYALVSDAVFDIDFTVTKTYQDKYGNGNSTTKDSTHEYLKSINVNVTRNNVDWDLDGNPDGTDTIGWKPLGFKDNEFSGNFYGLGHSIRNLYINSDTGRLGLFGIISGSKINKVTFKNAYVENRGSAWDFGALVGLAYGDGTLIDEVKVENSNVNGSGNTGSAGGMIGSATTNTTVSNSSAEVNVFAKGSIVGGLIGRVQSESSIVTSSADGDVYATSWSAGGLIGVVEGNSLVSGCNSSGNVIAGDNRSGGLISILGDSSLIDGYATGNVAGIKGSVGGLIGELSSPSASSGTIAFGSTVSGSYSSGDVYASGIAAGGLIGYVNVYNLGKDINISSSYNKNGNVEGVSFVGGLIGSSNVKNSAKITVSDCYVEGVSVKGDESSTKTPSSIGLSSTDTFGSNIGGLIGRAIKTTVIGCRVGSTGSATTLIEGTLRAGGMIGFSANSIVENGDVINTNVKGSYFVGGAVGLARASSLSNIDVNSEKLSSLSVKGDRAVGGIVGDMLASATLSSSYVSNMYIKGYSILGGAVGEVSGSSSVSDSTSEGISVGVPNGTSSNKFFSSHECGGSNKDRCIGGFAGLVSSGSSLERGESIDFIVKSSNYYYIGGLAGYVEDSDIRQSQAKDVDISGKSHCGGLVGRAIFSSTIKESRANGDVRGSGNIVGGLVAYVGSSSSLEDSYYKGDVEGNYSVGGVVGQISNAKASRVYFGSGTVNGFNTVGGVVGSLMNGAEISTSFSSSGTVKADSGDAGGVGGIVGCSGDKSKISRVFAYNVSMSGVNNLGGIVGLANGESKISEALFSGNFSLNSTDIRIGGIAGKLENSNISNSYVTRYIPSDSNIIGGLVGIVENGKVENSYIKGDIIGRSNYVGGLIGNPSSNSLAANYSYIYGDVTRAGSLITDNDSNYNIYGDGTDKGTNRKITATRTNEYLSVTSNHWSSDIWSCLKTSAMTPMLKNTSAVESGKLLGSGLADMGWSSDVWNNRCSLTPELLWEGISDSSTCSSNACKGTVIEPEPDPDGYNWDFFGYDPNDPVKAADKYVWNYHIPYETVGVASFGITEKSYDASTKTFTIKAVSTYNRDSHDQYFPVTFSFKTDDLGIKPSTHTELGGHNVKVFWDDVTKKTIDVIIPFDKDPNIYYMMIFDPTKVISGGEVYYWPYWTTYEVAYSYWVQYSKTYDGGHDVTLSAEGIDGRTAEIRFQYTGLPPCVLYTAGRTSISKAGGEACYVGQYTNKSILVWVPLKPVEPSQFVVTWFYKKTGSASSAYKVATRNIANIQGTTFSSGSTIRNGVVTTKTTKIDYSFYHGDDYYYDGWFGYDVENKSMLSSSRSDGQVTYCSPSIKSDNADGSMEIDMYCEGPTD